MPAAPWTGRLLVSSAVRPARWPHFAPPTRAIDLVFANEVGRPIESGNLLRRSFWPLLKAAGLPRIRFHDLRHSAATLMLGLNVHPQGVSVMPSHSQIRVTLDL